MVVPTTITLEEKKNEQLMGIFVATVDLDSLGDAEADIGAFHKEDFVKTLLQFFNEGANDYSIAMYGVAEQNQPVNFDQEPEAIPPDFASGKWFPLPNGVGDVAAGESLTFTNTDAWTWILIRANLKNAGQATTGKLFIRSAL